MHRNPVQELTVGTPRLTVILMHGRTLTPDYMEGLAHRLGLSDIRYVFPEADGNSWYPQSFLAPLTENEPQLSAAITHYESTVASLIARGTPAERIAVGGFSQGACLSAEFLARHPRRYGAAVLWTGGLIGPEGTAAPPAPALNGMPAYLTTSETDPYVPPWRVRETAAWLKACGAAVTCTVFKQREHLVSDEEIAAARAMLASVG